MKPEAPFHWDALCQGNPVIIQVVTPGGRAEQNGVKAGWLIVRSSLLLPS